MRISSHGGRRTAIANWAGRISAVGGSLRDVEIPGAFGIEHSSADILCECRRDEEAC